MLPGCGSGEPPARAQLLGLCAGPRSVVGRQLAVVLRSAPVSVASAFVASPFSARRLGPLPRE
eukprot:932064-Pyramimonas_sp.AAC.1